MDYRNYKAALGKTLNYLKPMINRNLGGYFESSIRKIRRSENWKPEKHLVY
jgi:hypothetical protein